MTSPYGSPADQEEDFFSISFSEEETGKKTPDGVYDAECVDVAHQKNKKGEPQLILTWAVTRGEYAGKEFKMFLTKSVASFWKIEETLKNLGLENKVIARSDTEKVISTSVFKNAKSKIDVKTFKGDKGEMQTVNRCLPR